MDNEHETPMALLALLNGIVSLSKYTGAATETRSESPAVALEPASIPSELTPNQKFVAHVLSSGANGLIAFGILFVCAAAACALLILTLAWVL